MVDKLFLVDCGPRMVLLLMHREIFTLQAPVIVLSDRLPKALATSQLQLEILERLVLEILIGLQLQLYLTHPLTLLWMNLSNVPFAALLLQMSKFCNEPLSVRLAFQVPINIQGAVNDT